MFRSLLTLLSAVMLLAWAAISVNNSWIAQAGLGIILLALLICGSVLLVVGIRDLIRDLSRFLHARSHHNQQPY